MGFEKFFPLPFRTWIRLESMFLMSSLTFWTVLNLLFTILEMGLSSMRSRNATPVARPASSRISALNGGLKPEL